LSTNNNDNNQDEKAEITTTAINNPYADLFSLIQDKQVELSLRQSQKKEIEINGQKYTRKPLTTKQWREIFILNDNMSKTKDDEIKRLDILIELRTKGAEYYFGIPADVFDKNYEDLSPIIEGCILRSNTGLSPDIDFEEILQKYKAQNTRK
jgi:hypothetical protein